MISILINTHLHNHVDSWHVGIAIYVDIMLSKVFWGFDPYLQNEQINNVKLQQSGIHNATEFHGALN